HGNTVIPTRALGLLMMSGVERGRTRTAAWVVLGVGAVLVLVSFMNVTITHRVVDTAFTLAAGEEYFKWEDEELPWWLSGISYYPPPGACALKGQAAVAGEGIHVAVHQSSFSCVLPPRWREIEGSFVDGEFTFTLDPTNAHEYIFTFDNTAGDAESHVTFVLDETRTGNPFQLLMWSSLSLAIRFFFLLLAVLLLACLLPVGCLLIVWGLIRRRRRARLRKLAFGDETQAGSSRHCVCLKLLMQLDVKYPLEANGYG
ncbi:MAG: hypothetical protein GTO14_24945, partial [Anaerolineales bacterium]|nr:hypothetical protein [Anaerolineales bacterium]